MPTNKANGFGIEETDMERRQVSMVMPSIDI